jgi:hypothetical protein
MFGIKERGIRGNEENYTMKNFITCFSRNIIKVIN